MRVIKHVSIEHCASTCRGRQAEVADLGLEIGRIDTHKDYDKIDVKEVEHDG